MESCHLYQYPVSISLSYLNLVFLYPIPTLLSLIRGSEVGSCVTLTYVTETRTCEIISRGRVACFRSRRIVFRIWLFIHNSCVRPSFYITNLQTCQTKPKKAGILSKMVQSSIPKHGRCAPAAITVISMLGANRKEPQQSSTPNARLLFVHGFSDHCM